MSLTTDFLLRLTATQRGTNDFGNDVFNPTMKATLQTTDGTTANKADILFMDERTVADGADDDIDLAGALSDAFGSTITMVEVVAIFVINVARDGTANTTDLTIGGATNAFEGFLGGTGPTVGPIKPGGWFAIGAGDAAGIGAVSAGSTDELRVTNGAGAAATYQIAIVGRSA